MSKDTELKIRLTEGEKERLAKYCEERDKTMSEVVRAYIRRLVPVHLKGAK